MKFGLGNSSEKYIPSLEKSPLIASKELYLNNDGQQTTVIHPPAGG
jgi:hypothetical protein